MDVDVFLDKLDQTYKDLTEDKAIEPCKPRHREYITFNLKVNKTDI